MQRNLRSRIFLSLLKVMLLCSVIAVALPTLPPLHANAAVSSPPHANVAVSSPLHANTAASSPSLGTAGSFAVLSGTTIDNTGPTTLGGDLGMSPGTSCNGFPSPCSSNVGSVSGTIHVADTVAAQAQADAVNEYALAAAQTCTTTFLPGTDMGGMTLDPGVYCFPSSATITGMLTLDGQGNPNAVFIFVIGSTLATASASTVLLTNGAQPSNVFWQVNSSATLGAMTSFAGSLVAQTSITAMAGATSSCGLYALNGTVTLDSDSIQTCFYLAFTNASTVTMTEVVHGTNSFSFPTTIFDLRNSSAGWRLEAASAGLTQSFNGTTTTIPLTFTSSTVTCTPTNGQEATCVTPTFHPIALSTTPQYFLTTGTLTSGSTISGTFNITTHSTFSFADTDPAGTYTGTITITLITAS